MEGTERQGERQVLENDKQNIRDGEQIKEERQRREQVLENKMKKK